MQQIIRLGIVVSTNPVKATVYVRIVDANNLVTLNLPIVSCKASQGKNLGLAQAGAGKNENSPYRHDSL